ncbi:hypothetical protein AVEN_36245-1 [Araneus ventricosus]|uniref:Uncharacterized protein n=1 Tax=Araneus ventricosus TaxID=182803 RepID=A0A4Y2VCR3_ARAVE|nr:hypothetical protein AVEN_192361-1 [Araneus ventricosus]GBO22332.1 hypothetical protein AVEN_36245-1 [Araneus ventricosus]
MVEHLLKVLIQASEIVNDVLNAHEMGAFAECDVDLRHGNVEISHHTSDSELNISKDDNPSANNGKEEICAGID